jgi:hypothetical protein
MPAARYDIVIEQFVDFTLTMVRRSDGNPVDLTGYTALMQIRPRPSRPVIVELSTENGRIQLGGPAGTIALAITGEDTGELAPTHRAVYDLLLQPPGPVSPVRMLEGNCSIRAGVTQP